MKRNIIFYAILLLLGFIINEPALSQEDELNILNGWMKYTDAPNSLYKHLAEQAYKLIDKRTEQIEQLKTKEDWIKRQKKTREKLFSIVGPFPEKTPLNAQVLSIVQKQGFRVEHVIYESMPKFFITASLFIPENLKRKTPAILYFSGHSTIAFRNVHYQQFILNLVQKGFIVLAIDPIGQGERLQYYDERISESLIGGPVEEHSYPGVQCFISGSSIARYFIWDGIRSIDYLLTRSEVDPNNIGCTGRSGGGTQSLYVAAFDKRIKAAAPTDYTTNFKRLFESIGPQDAEQNFYHGLASGIDFADLFEVRAPKPALIVATTRDFFSIQGTLETFHEVRRVYHTFDKKQNIQLATDDFTHHYTKKNREAIYRFFQKHLELGGDATEHEVEYLTPEELQVTSTGQVSTTFGGETVFSINKKETVLLLDNLEKERQNLTSHIKNVKESAKKLSGFSKPDTTLKEIVYRGSYQRDGYSLVKYFMKGEGDYVIPFLLMLPEKMGVKSAVIYLHPEGKSEEANPGETMEWLVKQGNIVLAPDLIGIGEMGQGVSQENVYNQYQFKVDDASNNPYNLWFAGVQIARSLVGIHAGDIIRCVNYLKSRDDVNSKKISAIAVGTMSPSLLHAATFEPAISKIALIEPYLSYRSIVTNEYYKPEFVLSTVPGALKAYDLPDLAACLAPRKLLMVNITNQKGKRAPLHSLQKELSITKSTYLSKSAEKKFSFGYRESHQSKDVLLSEWIK